MGLFKIILWGIVLYYLYKFVFNVVVPVGKTANNIKKTMQQMNENLQQQQQQYNNTHKQDTTATNNTQSKPKAGEYIEFEEIKN